MDLTEDELTDIHNEIYVVVFSMIEDNLIHFYKINFKKFIVDECTEYILQNGIYQEWCSEEDYKEIEILIDNCYETNIEYIFNLPERQSVVLNTNPNKYDIKDTLSILDKYPNPKQRSLEWYTSRSKLFSASNLYKLLGSNSQYNSLIYEKCKPQMRQFDSGVTNNKNPLNWGIKYEPVTVMIYESMYNTTVNTNYGCIPHPTLPIGASPDGIVTDITSDKYGNLVEIKNIYNREINGVPSEEYWIQMQSQMECTNIDHCDFIETRIKEYSDYTEYKDGIQKYKGVILFLIPNDMSHMEESKFIYMPLNVKDETKWIDSQCELYIGSHNIYEKIYWYLDEWSHVLVNRNKTWFKELIPTIQKAWNTVQEEKITGVEHRAPQKRKPRFEETVVPSSTLQESDTDHGVHRFKVIPNSVCLIKLDESGNVYKIN